jgi:hypothetical protein
MYQVFLSEIFNIVFAFDVITVFGDSHDCNTVVNIRSMNGGMNVDKYTLCW